MNRTRIDPENWIYHNPTRGGIACLLYLLIMVWEKYNYHFPKQIEVTAINQANLSICG